jgi:hypothetical protein
MQSVVAQPQNLGLDSLRSLTFLPGVWTLDNTSEPSENLEFHWSTRQGNPVLVGRRWSGYEAGCPWCVAQSAVLAEYDATFHQVRLHFVDRDQHFHDFHLLSAEKNSIVFSTDERLALPVYQLTFARKGGNALELALSAQSKRDRDFVPLMQARFHRR